MNGSAIRERITPLFGVEEYNLIMLAWLLIATVSFILLNWTRLGAESGAASNNTSTETNLPVDESVLLVYFLFFLNFNEISNRINILLKQSIISLP